MNKELLVYAINELKSAIEYLYRNIAATSITEEEYNVLYAMDIFKLCPGSDRDNEDVLLDNAFQALDLDKVSHPLVLLYHKLWVMSDKKSINLEKDINGYITQDSVVLCNVLFGYTSHGAPCAVRITWDDEKTDYVRCSQEEVDKAIHG